MEHVGNVLKIRLFLEWDNQVKHKPSFPSPQTQSFPYGLIILFHSFIIRRNVDVHHAKEERGGAIQAGSALPNRMQFRLHDGRGPLQNDVKTTWRVQIQSPPPIPVNCIVLLHFWRFMSSLPPTHPTVRGRPWMKRNLKRMNVLLAAFSGFQCFISLF